MPAGGGGHNPGIMVVAFLILAVAIAAITI